MTYGKYRSKEPIVETQLLPIVRINKGWLPDDLSSAFDSLFVAVHVREAILIQYLYLCKYVQAISLHKGAAVELSAKVFNWKSITRNFMHL